MSHLHEHSDVQLSLERDAVEWRYELARRPNLDRLAVLLCVHRRHFLHMPSASQRRRHVQQMKLARPPSDSKGVRFSRTDSKIYKKNPVLPMRSIIQGAQRSRNGAQCVVSSPYGFLCLLVCLSLYSPFGSASMLLADCVACISSSNAFWPEISQSTFYNELLASKKPNATYAHFARGHSAK